MPRVEVPSGETVELIPSGEAAEAERNPDNTEGFEYEVESGSVRVGHNSESAKRGRTFGPGSEGLIDPKGREMYAFGAASDESVVYIETATFYINVFNASQESGSDVESFTWVPDNDGIRIDPDDAAPVLRGAEVLIQADPGNAGTVYVGGSGGQYHALEPGLSLGLGVGSVDRIYAYTAEPGDKINVTHEVR